MNMILMSLTSPMTCQTPKTTTEAYMILMNPASWRTLTYASKTIRRWIMWKQRAAVVITITVPVVAIQFTIITMLGNMETELMKPALLTQVRMIMSYPIQATKRSPLGDEVFNHR